MRKLYPKYITAVHNGVIQKSIQGSLMELDVQDQGLARDLASWGIREPHTTRAYQSELNHLAQKSEDTITVVDVGANIGYYALMPPSMLDDVRVIAIEAEEKNIINLKKNIELNGYSDVISVIHCAVGSERTTAEIHRSTHSNRHSMQSEFKDENPGIVSESVEIDVRPLDNIVRDAGLNPADVDVVRMDVEGYEANIFKGMSEILSSSGSILFQIEVHPNLLSDEEMDYLLSTINQGDVEIASAARGRDDDSIESVEEIRNWNFAELVLKFKD